MTEPCSEPCVPWTTPDELRACRPGSLLDPSISDDDLEEHIFVASSLLYEFSGRKYAGSCRDVVRPCAADREPVYTYINNQQWFVGCGCNRGEHCGCSPVSEITLGVEPVTSIVAVKADGDVVDPFLYRVDDWLTLVRLPDPDGTRPGWKCCQTIDLDSSQPNTFEVEFVYGQSPPRAGRRAANLLAAQTALACFGSAGECTLPERVTSISRQGVSMLLLDPFTFFRFGRTGIYQVDSFISAVNAMGTRGRAHVSSPDIGRPVRRVGT